MSVILRLYIESKRSFIMKRFSKLTAVILTVTLISMFSAGCSGTETNVGTSTGSRGKEMFVGFLFQ